MIREAWLSASVPFLTGADFDEELKIDIAHAMEKGSMLEFEQ